MLQFNDNTQEEVRELYNLDKPGRMDEAVQLLDSWIKKQDHFVVKNFSKQYLERMIIASKGSTERAKERIDKLCTVKTLMPQLFLDVDAKEYFNALKGKVTHVTLPQLTPSHERVVIAKYVGNQFNSKMILDGYRCCIMHTEYFRAFDYAASYQVVVDFRDGNITDFVKNANILDLRQSAVVAMEGYGLRIKGVHIVTGSKLVDLLIGIAKQVLNEKLRNRVHVHKELETLYNVIPKHLLPKDLGGLEKCVEDLNDEWMEVLGSKEFRDYWRTMIKACTDESKRQSGKFTETYMGMPGSFRKLNVD